MQCKLLVILIWILFWESLPGKCCNFSLTVGLFLSTGIHTPSQYSHPGLAGILKDFKRLTDLHVKIFEFPNEKATEGGILFNALLRYGQGNGKGEPPKGQRTMDEELFLKSTMKAESLGST